MWRYRHLFLSVCAVCHGVLVAFGYPFIHESITKMLPELWRDINSPVGWVFLMAGFWMAPIVIVGVDFALLVTPAVSTTLLFLLSRRLLPKTSLSLSGLSPWTVGVVIIACTYIALELLVTGGLPVPNVIVHPVDQVLVKSVPASVHALGALSAVSSALLLAILIKRGIRKASAEAV